MAVAIRELAAALSVMEILAVRTGIGLIVMLALLVVRPELRATIRSRHPALHLFRNTVHLGGQYLWALSLLLLPLATVFALEFTTPAWALLLAVPVLGERLTASRVGAVVLGLLGVLVVLRPGLAAFQPAALLVLVVAVALRRHADHHQEAHQDRQHVRDHLLDERHPAAAGPARLRSAVPGQAEPGFAPGLLRHGTFGPRLALLPGQRVPLRATPAWWCRSTSCACR